MKIGYFLSCEEYTPAELVEQARLAEEAGFSSLWISDHYHPWNDEQGQSPFVWPVIGAVSQACSLPVTTAVTCPTVRIHPAVIAQAAATSAVLLSGRFVLGVGSGEALNEHILGDPWPSIDVAARIGDGYVATMPDADMVDRFKDASGGRPAVAGAKVAFADSEEEGVRIAHRLWANSGVPGELAQVLPSPRHFEQASQLVTEEMTGESVTAGNDVQAHLDNLKSYAEAGYDEVNVANMGPHWREMIEFYGREVLPTFSA